MNTILFDLDGTLLPMDTKGFMDTYTKALTSRIESAGFDSKRILNAIWTGTDAMFGNEGVLTNEDIFMKTFEECLGRDTKKVVRELNKFYNKDFIVSKLNTSPNFLANECVKLLKEKGYVLAIATNPIFPAVATQQRISWAGLDIDDFALVTTYENTCFTKPNLNYYKKILQTLGRQPEDCLMVGNDIDEDLCVVKLGMDVFLIKDCLINRSRSDITDYKQGSFETFKGYVESLPSLI